MENTVERKKEEEATGKRYRLAAGTQVRDEDFGLLFYTVNGPRLYFLPCGQLLEWSFFQSDLNVSQWLRQRKQWLPTEKLKLELEKALRKLEEKGVILGY